ncbi:MAG: outer membrane beta-barrel protein [Cytophagales bacterium]
METDYLNLPVVFKFYPFSGFNFQAGPQFDFLMGATGPVQTGGPLTIQEISDNMNKLAISGFTGIGWDFSLGLTLEARYIHGLTNIYKSGGSQTKNQLIQFSLGYKLSKF